MKTFFIAISILFFASFAFAEPEILFGPTLPKESKGRKVQSIRWKDVKGEHLTTITVTDKFVEGKQPGECGVSNRELLVECLKEEGIGEFHREWAIRDEVYQCPASMELEPLVNKIRITDLNQNGIAEVWIPYRIGCRGDVSPVGLKIIMYEGGKKYAMRGTTYSRVGLGQNDYDGGSYVMDKHLQDKKVFCEYGHTLWESIKAY